MFYLTDMFSRSLSMIRRALRWFFFLFHRPSPTPPQGTPDAMRDGVAIDFKTARPWPTSNPSQLDFYSSAPRAWDKLLHAPIYRKNPDGTTTEGVGCPHKERV